MSPALTANGHSSMQSASGNSHLQIL